MTNKAIEPIKDKYPSICYDCVFRRAAADSNIEKGYVGCVAVFDQFEIGNPTEEDISYITEAKEIAVGWIYHKRYIEYPKDNTLGSGVMTNGQIITKEVKKCSKFELS